MAFSLNLEVETLRTDSLVVVKSGFATFEEERLGDETCEEPLPTGGMLLELIKKPPYKIDDTQLRYGKFLAF
ncbi:MAG: hypothetical protein FJZ58_06590 [Chlamydiae bacterium]|nr:hypothetical protein [Chlamydiota bacterium]